MIKYRMVVMDKEGFFKFKLDSMSLPVGRIQLGNEVLHPNGQLYKVVKVVVDLEVRNTRPEMHVEMIEMEE